MSFPTPASIQKSIDETKVDYVRLGTSGLRVSFPILGGMFMGNENWAPGVLSQEAAVDLFKAAYDRGLNTWDTANMYSNGLSEEAIGKTLKKFSIPRHKVVIMTKCSEYVAEDVDVLTPAFGHLMVDTKDYVNQAGKYTSCDVSFCVGISNNYQGPSRSAIFTSVDASLARLGTDYIDVLQLHRYNGEAMPEETMKALHDLVQSGKVRYIGASSMWATQFATLQFVAEKNGWTKFIVMQNYYNLCYREEEREMIRFCKETGVGIIPWSPLYGGQLAKPLGVKDSPRSKAGHAGMGSAFTQADEVIIKRVEEVATKKGWSMAQVGLIWLKTKGTVPITGISSIARLEEAAGLRGKELTQGEISYLEEPYVPKPVAGHA